MSRRPADFPSFQSLFTALSMLGKKSRNGSVSTWKPSARTAKCTYAGKWRQHVQRIYLACVLIAFLCFAGLAGAQGAPGFPSFTPQDCGQFDCINLQNLNVSLNVPVMGKNGAFPFEAKLTGGDSYVASNGANLVPGIVNQPITPIVNNVLSPFGYTQVLASSATSGTCPTVDGSGSATEYSNWYLLMTDGTVHSLPLTDVVWKGATCTSTLTDQVIDGTGWTVTIVGSSYNASTQAGVTVVSRAGMTVNIQSATLSDSQSTPNKVSYNSPSSQEFSDTLGAWVMTVNANAAGQLTWSDTLGNPQTESQTVTTATLKTVLWVSWFRSG